MAEQNNAENNAENIAENTGDDDLADEALDERRVKYAGNMCASCARCKK